MPANCWWRRCCVRSRATPPSNSVIPTRLVVRKSGWNDGAGSSPPFLLPLAAPHAREHEAHATEQQRVDRLPAEATV